VSSNGIDDEEFIVNSVKFSSRKILPTGVRRNRNGLWSLSFVVDVVAELPDGRGAIFAGEFRVQGRQVGRKPRKPETKPRKGRERTT
jgi:hypothetical protein